MRRFESALLLVGGITVLAAGAFATAGLSAGDGPAGDANAQCIKPYTQNPRYWQYKGQPVMLLGGSKTDHIFLLEDLESHLDEMQAVGANYVRCTMSQREAIELKPHKLLAEGKFDLDAWNPEYWRRFQDMLRWTAQRDIIVQIEVWDRFDYSTDCWEHSPWRPDNNVNYTHQQTGLADQYPQPAHKDAQPFFHSIPGMPRYNPKLDLIRGYQESFVTKMLSHSLDYGHVLYCMNNETSTPATWGQYWIDFIQTAAAEKGGSVYTTDMFDDAFRAERAVHTPIVFRDAEHYMFADISQVNSRNFDQAHWDNLLWLVEQVNQYPRPCNHTKIYGSGYYSFGTGGPEDGVERFWRNILGGSASARFHRPDGGNGLNDYAKGAIRAARLLETKLKYWDIVPHMELLSDRESNEAYLAAKPADAYALYFTDGGSVTLDLSDAPGPFEITWISVSSGVTTRTWAGGDWRQLPIRIQGGRPVKLSAPYQGGWVAALVKQ
jgi:hypothetical protein